jgi:hypothetical protein
VLGDDVTLIAASSRSIATRVTARLALTVDFQPLREQSTSGQGWAGESMDDARPGDDNRAIC